MVGLTRSAVQGGERVSSTSAFSTPGTRQYAPGAGPVGNSPTRGARKISVWRTGAGTSPVL
jgi:hypothetical protein